ncbi:MAG: hypothetical protein COZ05_07855 [Armatimonadetes bacterium CG_4_10_14_3_um_filter_59_10]|nr:MAG: hypothetical protein COZ05_07855 [Armatimonadetes bacterium CG_4_10_14_3_um_filter_59_10]
MLDLISVRDFSPVIHQVETDGLARRLKAERPPFSDATQAQLSALLEHYSIDEDLNRAAFDSILTGLGKERGKGYLINGVFGAGKSHLLSVLRLLAGYDDTRPVFLSAHPLYAAALDRTAPPAQMLVVPFSLDDYSGRDHDLENVFWRETARNLPDVASQLADRSLSRADRFDYFTETLQQSGRVAALWLVDELSTFLASKDYSGLQNDASFLQFVGQRCGAGRFYFVGTTQKSVEDIGAFEPYILEQIKDRFDTRGTLQMAGTVRLIRGRVVAINDERVLRQQAEELAVHWRDVLPGFAEGVEDIQSSYPFHPATLQILESVVSRFFSRTRSALRFAHDLVNSPPFRARNSDRLVTPDEIFVYFLPDIAAHPELRRLVDEVYAWYEQHVAALCPEDPEFGLRLIRLLVLLKIGNLQLSVDQIAHALLADLRLPGEANYGFVKYLLEKFRTEGNYITRLRSRAGEGDFYAVDLGIRINEAVRRRVDAVMATFTDTDRRVEQAALECCTGESFPLAELRRSTTFEVWWENTQRKLLCQFTDLRSLDPAELTHWVGTISDPATHEDGALFAGSLYGVEAQREQWIDNLRSISPSRAGIDGRWVGSLACLLPREMIHPERERLREFTACRLLTQDPSLKDNRRGRAILDRLREDLPGMTGEIERLLRDLYMQGEAMIGHEMSCRTAELVDTEQSWLYLLDTVARQMFPRVYPSFPKFAPRQRILSAAGSNQFVTEILRDGLPGNLASPAMDRVARGIGVPLRLVGELRRGLQYKPVPAELVVACEAALEISPKYRDVERSLLKSPLGLPPELTQIVVAAMIRQGQALAFDSEGAVIATEEIRAPLKEGVATLRRGDLLTESEWVAASEALAAWFPSTEALPRSFECQEKYWAHLCGWREQLLAQYQQAATSLNQLLEQTGQSPVQWQECREALTHAQSVIDSVSPAAPASEGLRQWVSRRAATPDAPALLEGFQARSGFLVDNTNLLIRMTRYLRDALLPTEHSLEAKRAELLCALTGGESIMTDWPRIWSALNGFLSDYITASVLWHRQQNDPRKVAEYLRVKESALWKQRELLRQLEGSISFRFNVDPIAAVLNTFCAYPQLSEALARSPVCPQCGKSLGAVAHRPTVEETQRHVRQEVERAVGTLSEDMCLGAIKRYAKELGDACPRCLTAMVDALSKGEPEAFLALLSADSVKHARRALLPRRRVTRQVGHLHFLLAGKVLPKRAVMAEVETWLDGDEGLRSEDEVQFK